MTITTVDIINLYAINGWIFVIMLITELCTEYVSIKYNGSSVSNFTPVYGLYCSIVSV